MAKCPICKKDFDDALSYCLDDGAYLLADRSFDGEAPTVVSKRSSGQSAWTILAVVVIGVAGFALIGGGAILGVFYYLSTGERAALDVQTESPNSNRTPSPLDTLGNVNPSDRSTPPTIDLKKPLEKVDKKPVPKQISGGVINGKAISLPKPPYPAAARAVRASGSVTVQVLVDESGNVVSASAISGHPLLRAAAASAARGAKFNPTLLSGQPVRVSGVLTYNFQP